MSPFERSLSNLVNPSGTFFGKGDPESLLDFAARWNTGRLGVKDAQRRVRREMFRQAFQASGGNRHAMARLLGVDRSYVLRMLRDGIVPVDADELVDHAKP